MREMADVDLNYTKQDVKDLAFLVNDHKHSVKKIHKYSSPEAILKLKEQERHHKEQRKHVHNRIHEMHQIHQEKLSIKSHDNKLKFKMKKHLNSKKATLDMDQYLSNLHEKNLEL